MSDFFCKLPWINIETEKKDTARPCCQWQGAGYPIGEYFSNQELLEAKRQLLQGKAPRQCQFCEDNEREIGHSLRLSEKLDRPELEQEILARHDAEWWAIERLSIVASNVCNLKCLPCTNGSYVRDKENFDLGFRIKPPEIYRKNNLHLYRDLGFSRLTVNGGEPFYDQIAMQFLQDLVDAGRSQNIRVDINSNMTAATPDRIDWLSANFKHVIIKASVDGITGRNDYLRWPSDWKQIETHMSYAAEKSNITVVITSAVSNLSLLTFDEVIRYAVDHRYNLFITPVMNPKQLNVHRLPLVVKAALATRYRDLREQVKHTAWNNTLMALDTVIQICDDPSDWDLQELEDYLRRHDDHRGTQVLTAFPELYNYFTRNP